ncbi:MAG: glycoside hydrolase family 65 protein, partial [Verrucomicrobia bacterium]|nr:glycoside hydrolase family 65 protein [Cytophagales bacterium]
PMKIVSDPVQIKKDLDYYESRMDVNGPAMSFAILTLLHNRLGNLEKATTLFDKSYLPNKVPPFGVLAETAGGTNPYFATGAGGFLQVLLSGFGGLDITPNGIVQLKTKIPTSWKSLTIKGIGVEKKTFVVK